jgi:hypothetical protein
MWCQSFDMVLLQLSLRPWQLDRTVKIWFVPPASKLLLTREDKPLFSSSKIHKARVLSVSWWAIALQPIFSFTL